MVTAASENFTKSYSHWLLERIETVERGRGFELSTPFLDPFNDGLRVFAEPKGNGFFLHDDGLTLENLACMGMDTHSSERRQRILKSALSGCGVMFEGGRLQIEASVTSLPQRIHLLLMAMLRVNDLWMTVTPHRTTDFFEMVCEFLDQQNVSFSTNVSIPGKTVEHPIDILISFHLDGVGAKPSGCGKGDLGERHLGRFSGGWGRSAQNRERSNGEYSQWLQ